MNIKALRKNLRMIWKPNKKVQINEVDDELYLVEFGDGRNKKKVMEMCPWSYEKQLILLKEFEGEQAPKDISLWQCPFWVQIHKPPLKSRTKDRLGDRVKVRGDVAESIVHWGEIFRGKGAINVTKKPVQGKKGLFSRGGGGGTTMDSLQI